jgi:multidrug efflux pump subunit AcrB
LNALIAFSIKQRVLVLALFIMTLFGGLLAFRQLNIEAYPRAVQRSLLNLMEKMDLRPPSAAA